MRLVCPGCGEFIAGADIDLGKSLAVCRPCGEIIGLPAVAQVDDDGRIVHEGTPSFLAREIANLPLYAYRPSDLICTETREPRGAAIFVGEDRGAAVIYVIVALFWNAFLWAWYSLLRSTDGSILGPLRFLFPALHLGVGVYLLYGCVCLLLNRARLAVSPARFTCEVGPLPFHPPISEPQQNVRCFVDTQYIVYRLPDRWFRQRIAWTVRVLLRDNRSIDLPLYLINREHARYLVVRLNRALDEVRALSPRPGTLLALPPGVSADANADASAEASGDPASQTPVVSS